MEYHDYKQYDKNLNNDSNSNNEHDTKLEGKRKGFIPKWLAIIIILITFIGLMVKKYT